MECPFLKKISFKKVNQIVTDDNCQSLKDCDNILPTDQDFDFREDSIDQVQSSAANKHQIYYFNSKITPPQKTNKPLQIRFPKQFQTKKMLHQYMPSLSEVEQDSIGEQTLGDSEIMQQKNVPQALISKMSMLASKCEHIFHGCVQINNDSQSYDCSLLGHCIKISKQDKTKYFIDLAKSNCRLQSIKDCSGKLAVTQQKHSLNIQLKFNSYQKLAAFAKALQVNSIEVQHQKEMNEMDQHYNLNVSNSLDSLGFQVERIPIEKLSSMCDNFDIILFKNKNLMSKVQRLFTNSDYDHVALLLKTADNEIYLLEASSNVGVAVYTLSSLIKIPKNKYYLRIGYRRYQGERKLSQILRLQQFIKESVGKPYKFDPMYLLSSDVKKQQTYFCSQLVAQALQKCGMMELNKPAYKYLPKHFSISEINQALLSGKYSEIALLE